MFQFLDFTKIMNFNDGRPSLTYFEALKELATKLNVPHLLDESGPVEWRGTRREQVFNLGQIITTALRFLANALLKGEDISQNKSFKQVAAFYEWVQGIHNDRLVAAEGQRFPNNIVYDMLSNLRNEKTRIIHPDYAVLQFFLEGANARKISKGETPSLDFISTALIAYVLTLLHERGYVVSSQGTMQFLKDFSSISLFKEPQQKLEACFIELKQDPVYGILSAANIFDYESVRNESTGANRYLMEKAVEKGISALQAYPEEVNSEGLKTMALQVQMAYSEVLPAFVEAEKESTPQAIALAKWGASEWLARFDTALTIVSRLYSDPQIAAIKQAFDENPFAHDVMRRSAVGDFPGNERNEALSKVELTKLFLQDQFALSHSSSAQHAASSSSPAMWKPAVSTDSATDAALDQEAGATLAPGFTSR